MNLFLPLLLIAASSSCAHAAPSALVEKVATRRIELASTLLEAFDANEVCETNAYPAEVVKEFANAKAVATPEAFGELLKSVPTDSKMRANVAFRLATGSLDLLGDHKVEEIRVGLLGAKFFHYGHGAMGSEYNITLGDRGEAKVNKLITVKNEPVWEATTVKWAVVASREGGFVLKIGKDKFLPQTGELGEFLFVPADRKDDVIDPNRTLTTNDSYCEA